MKIHLISPRLSIHKGDFLGSGVPYWPVELAVFAAFLRNAGHEPSVSDLFGMSPGTFSEDGSLYWQGASISSAVNIKGNETLFVIYAISYMSLSEIESIVTYLKLHFGHIKVAVLENSQAVTAFDLDAESERLFDAGADFLILGEPYFNWEEIIAFVNDTGDVPNNVKTPTKSEITASPLRQTRRLSDPSLGSFPSRKLLGSTLFARAKASTKIFANSDLARVPLAL